jgi:hypothetical protein
MKKLIAIALVTLAGSSVANARLVRSRTFNEKEKAPTEWIIRAGVSLNNAAGDGVSYLKDDDGDGFTSVGPRCGLDVSIAFNKPFITDGLYWGMELGFGSRGASAKNEWYDEYWDEGGTDKAHIATWNAKFSPFTIGYKYAINDAIKLDAHLGAFVSYDFAGSAKYEWADDDDPDKLDFNDITDDLDFKCFDAGVQVGVGVWYKRFNFDITYQRGFVNACEASDLDGNSVYSSNLMLRVGVAF